MVPANAGIRGIGDKAGGVSPQESMNLPGHGGREFDLLFELFRDLLEDGFTKEDLVVFDTGLWPRRRQSGHLSRRQFSVQHLEDVFVCQQSLGLNKRKDLPAQSAELVG